ncbi:5-hydroxytryptamine receptor 1B-like [Hydra vulgaris]|uniref:5-hydroxytryptamine receptor 1B-like n=1 Tax=Hydra vulgaris TaxID=6087 RepID=A0ABM4CQL4_HYDVU
MNKSLTNNTTKLVVSSTRVIFSLTGLSLLSLFIIIINLYCLIITYQSRKLHKPSNVAICSLILAHLVQGVIVIPLYTLKRSNFEIPFLTCDMFRFFYMLTNYAACLSLMIVTIDRFLHLQIPFKYRVYITVKRICIFLVIMWIYTIALCLIPFVNQINRQDCSYIPSKLWTTLMLICNTSVPLLFTIILYLMIFKKARAVEKKKRLIQNLRFVYLNKSNIVFLIVFCYVICWGPSCIYYLLESLCHERCFRRNYHNSTSEKIVTLIMKIMTFMDGFIAPFIYCIGNRTFKKASKLSRNRMKVAFSNILDRSSIVA